VSPLPCAPTQARRRSGGTVGRPPPHAGAADQLFTSAPCAAHAAATSSCVPRLYPLCSYHTEAKFFSVSSPLASALLLPCELAVATVSRTPCHRPNRGTRTPTFPSPCSTPLELVSSISGPGASSSPAALPPLHWPPLTAASGAPPAPSTPPVVSLELGGAMWFSKMID
jgi:hypothetical protein